MEEEEKLNTATPSSDVEDVKQDNVTENLSKAVKEKNTIIRTLKDEIDAYKKNLEELREEIKKKKEDDPFLDDGLDKKFEELSNKKEELEKTVKAYEKQTQMAMVDSEIARLEAKYPDFADKELDVLMDVYSKTDGKVRNLGIIEDIYLAKKLREENKDKEAMQKRAVASTETPTAGSPPEDKPRGIAEAFARWRHKIK